MSKIWLAALPVPFVVLLAIALFVLVGVLALTTGSVSVSVAGLFGFTALDEMQSTVLWQLRFPRLLLALLAGAGLALCGALLQNASRNPLADPYLFGIVSGAALGATIATILLPDWQLFTALFAFVGALLAVFLVLLIGASSRWQRLESLLLCGVAVSFMLSAITTTLLYLSEPFAANRVMFWLMGSLSQASLTHVALISPLVLLTLLLGLLYRRQLDALVLSDESARSLGVNVQPLRFIILLLCAAVSAAIVACCGGIAFVGLMIPHLVRSLFGLSSVALLLGSVWLGAVFLALVDTLSRSLLPDQELPIGVVTSAIGSLFFLSMLFKYRRG
ncbi:iron ABC transporter permease [Rheinheimera mesophila]|uniref:Iron ABC transporter permease n=1 Tax=Rheinheimera mesophila TaxID=1547515 RepID=A0A3P3QEZ4_9GAMM|nr:iron ABC transporter permease [Rheinheimera mesophila]KKL00715.1 ABC transporter permease [Rheinheimera mesophila]RRJ19777.1 iron ABC transporter permease [Rheinheimera mesophila]